MKKFIYSVIVAVTLICATGCDVNEPVIENLSGTKWRYEEANGDYISLNFYSETNGSIIISIDNDPDSGSFTYTYNKPNVSIKLANGSMSGSISGNTMTMVLYASSNTISNLPFIKQ